MGILELELGSGEFTVKMGKDDLLVRTIKGYDILFRGERILKRIASNKEMFDEKFIPTDLIVATSHPGTTALVEVRANEIPCGTVAYLEGIDKIINNTRFVPIQFYIQF